MKWKMLLLLIVVMLVTPKCAQPQGESEQRGTVRNYFEILSSEGTIGNKLYLIKYKIINNDASYTCFASSFNGAMLRVTCP